LIVSNKDKSISSSEKFSKKFFISKLKTTGNLTFERRTLCYGSFSINCWIFLKNSVSLPTNNVVESKSLNKTCVEHCSISHC
jgi:hypothetical protein